MSTDGATDSPLFPIRLYAVDGFEDRKNDVVYDPPLIRSDDASVVVFFPGDVQDYTENMEAHRDNKHYKQWNLESTAAKLQTKFRHCHILIVKPSRMGYKTFSCYQNFVKSNQLGVPEYEPNHNALQHLDSLVKNVSERLKTLSLLKGGNSTENGLNQSVVTDSKNVNCFKDAKLENLNFQLIGFSKGCVVLNQLLHEFHYNFEEQNQDISSIVLKIKDMYWLDGGHSGGKDTWVTDKNILTTLRSLEVNVHVHVTPYQIQDEGRPWIKKEEKAFSDYLSTSGGNIDRTVHFEGVPPSILTHFDVLNAFK